MKSHDGMVPMLRAWPGLPVLAFAFLFLFLAADVASGAQPRTVLTPEQSAWVAGHGKVRLGIARTDWPPFDLVDYAGRHTGITADYLEMVQARTGLDIRPVLFGDWNQVLRALRAGQVDLVGSMAPTRERQTYLAFTEPYVSNPSIIVARKDRPEITGLESLRGKSVATEAGYATHELLRTQYPDIRLDVVKSTLDALMEVSLGKADGYVGDLIVSSWLIDRNSIANLEVRSQAHMTTGELAFAVRKNLPELADVVNAALASITDAEHRTIRQRWVPLGRTDAKKPATIELTPAERAWIAAHPKIRVGVNPAFEPLEYIDGQGRYAGLASEYLNMLQERLGLSFEVVAGSSWADVLERTQKRDLDMLAMITLTAEREKDLRFTQPYITLPMVVVTRSNARLVTDLANVGGETVALPKDYFAANYLADHYPNIRQMPVADMKEALRVVERGYAFATVGSVAVLGQEIQDKYIGKLKIAGTVDLRQDLRMATRADWPQLAALLDKGLASISEEERQAAQRKWLSVRVEYGIDWREVVKIGVPIAVAVLVVIAVMLIANRRLKRQVAETERKDAALKVQLAFQQTLMDTIPSPIIFKDSDARIYGCNRAYEEAFGVAREDLLGFTLLELEIFPPETRQRLYQDDLDLLQQPEGRKHDELRVKFADGLEHAVLYWKIAFRMSDGTVGGLLGVMVDITPLKELELAAHEARNAADAANRAKSAFLATMSHEIRTPMNAVLGMLELLSLTRLDAEQLRSLDIVRESATSLLRIIDDILDFSKIEAGKLEIKPEPTSVAEVLHSVHTIYSGVASAKHLLLRKSLDARIAPAILADPLRLRQILNNFVSNALKFTHQGEVEIRADLVEQTDGGQKLRLSVRDTGIGVSEESLKRLFEPFMQAEADTTRRYGGTGLGLTICRRLAEMMGGTVTMQSELGKGTTIAVEATFPLADASTLQQDGAQPAAALQKTVSTRRAAPTVAQAEAERTLVLVADDHPTNRMLLVRQLNTLGYAAEAVEDGVQALAAWQTGRFAILITDCHMPEMDGYELARRIRRIEAGDGRKRTPILACTANALQGEAAVCFDAGMDDYLPKPVEMRELLARLDRWLPISGAAPSAQPAVARAAEAGEEPIQSSALAEISGGDKAMERDILLDFRQSNDADARLLGEAYSRQDAESVRQVAHRMKGASRMVGAVGLADVCEQMEKAGKAQQWGQLTELRPKMEFEVQRLNRFLDML